MPLVLYRLKADLVHFLAPYIPLLYLGSHITTVHDLTLLDFKNIRRFKLVYELKYQISRLVFFRGLKSSKVLIAPSNFTKQQLIKRFHLATEKVVVVPGSAELTKLTPGHYKGSKEPFLLYVGNAYPYKNLPRLIRAVAIICQNRPEFKLVLVGQDDWFYSNLRRQVAKSNLKKNVVFTGFVSDIKLISLYQRAKLFVFPSLSEGFGLPGLEAMAYGVPVLAAQASCLPEVLGNAATYFNPTDDIDLVNKILELWDNPKKLKELKVKGYQQVKKYSWAKTAAKTLEIYNRF